MWIPKWYLEAQERRIDRMERRIKRLELICLEQNGTQNKTVGAYLSGRCKE